MLSCDADLDGILCGFLPSKTMICNFTSVGDFPRLDFAM